MTSAPQNGSFAGATGLTAAEAAARLERDGANELPASRPRSTLAVALDVAREPMALLLLACGGLYLALGDLHEAGVLLVFVFVVMGITLYQEQRTERVLEALRDLSSPRARVIRDGAPRRIAGREVVVGDLLVLAEGDRVPADARLIEAASLAADESLLTGESLPVAKRCGGGDDGDGETRVFSGTLIVRGRGLAEVSATGTATALGRIGGALARTGSVPTPLQRQTRILVRRVALVGAALSLAVLLGYGLLRGEWLTGLLAGLALAMSVLPEEFPVILAVFLALGGWRLSRHSVLTRRLPAVETLGAATVLCVDKTGTLTENRMSVQALWNGAAHFAAEAGGEPPEDFHALVEFAWLASARDPFDPTEQAIHRYGEAHLARTEHEHPDWTLVREYPLAPSLLSVSQVWRSPRRRQLAIAAKGAPEAIVDLCHLDAAEAGRYLAAAHALAAQGLRVLGVARATWGERAEAAEPGLPAGQHDFDFEPLGLLGLADPLRADVPAAIAECRAAGIRVLMITGDYAETAANIARQAGIAPDVVLTGAEFDALDDEELARRLRAVAVIARAVPEQKLRIVRALQAAGEVVAMTGDGVNDAPALKAADIGVAMGARGTDVAREAAALVLLDDAFASIVRAVRLGRRIHDNIRKAVLYVLVVHLPIAALALLPLFLGWPLILLPEHIALFELLIAPGCSLAFEAEPEEADVMARPPRARTAPLLDRGGLAAALLAGALGGAAALAVTAWAMAQGAALAESRTAAFLVVVLANVATIAAWRARRGAFVLSGRNPTARWVVVAALAALALLVGVAPVGALFGFVPPAPALAAACLAAASAYYGALLVLRRYT